MLLTAAAASVSMAQSQTAPAAPATATPAATAAPAQNSAEVDGGTPTWVKPETPEHRRDRLGTEDPGPNPDPKKQFARYGKLFHIERFDRKWAAYDVEEGWVRPFGFVNFSREVYQQNDKYVWVWMEDKPEGAPTLQEEIATAKPSPRYTEAQMKYLKYIRPEFQDLSVPKSTRTIRFEESSDGLPTTGSWRNSLDVGDMNGDGFADIVVPPMRGGGGAGAAPLIYLGDGQGHWKLWQNVSWPYGLQYGSAAVGDFNKDGHMDVAFGVHLNGVRCFLGDGKGHFTDASEGLPVDDYPTRRVMVTDADQDGNLDIVAISEGTSAVPRKVVLGKMVAFLNNGKGTKWTPQEITDNAKVFGGDWMAIGKFNNDKYPDFAGGSVFFQASQLLFRSGGKNKWDVVNSDGVVVPYLSYYYAMAAGRFRKGAQLDDLIMSYARFWPSDVDTTALADPPMKTLVGIDRVSFEGAEPKRTPILRWSSNRPIWGMASGDFDGDGNLDVAFTRYDPREIDILLGDGKGGFTMAQVEGLKALANTNYDLKVADVNGDGRPDIIMMYESAATTRLGEQDGSIHVFLNRGPVAAPAATKTAATTK